FYFQADDGVSGPELWKTDGTAAGTTLVKDFVPGPGGAYPIPCNVGGTLVILTTYPGGFELWQSDGTPSGTVPLQNSPAAVSANWLTDVNGTLFYTADDGLHGTELWKATPATPPTASGPILAVGPASGTPAVVHVFDAITNAEKFTLTPFAPTFTGGVRV